jgi:hypothetical protein
MAGADFSQFANEDRPHAATEPQVAVPSLNIFLGSTPSYSALEMMRQLVYLPEYDRRRVAMVYLDIDSPPSEVLQFRQEHPGVLREFDLRISVAHGVLYADQLNDTVSHHTYIPTKIPESFDNGAGGIRNNGHVAACTDLPKIVQVLDEALSAIGALPMDRGAKPVTEVLINIVAFLGGGTGSGILPSIAVMTRHRILQLNLKHRLNIFCLLPEHVREATTNDVSWRKSNATATLLELVALSSARGERRHDGSFAPYIKHMLHTPYEVRGTTIANEVYLFGQTSMHSAEDAARIIGLDLYTRVTNASGVGFLERSKSVDRRTLGNYDANGLPTMFGTTCPLEVAFPAVETATAFAKLTASRVLPILAGEQGEAQYQLNASEIDRVKEWDRVLAQPDPPDFTERQFQTAGRDRLDMLEARLNKHAEEIGAKIKDDTRASEAAEIKLITGLRLEPLGAQMQHLQGIRRVYTGALARVQDQNIPNRSRPDRMLQRKLLKAWPVLGMKDRVVAEVTDNYNRVQKRNIKAVLLTERKQLLHRLIAFVDDEMRNVKRFRGEVDSTQTIRELETQALASAAWRGQLDNVHVHRRHLFDLPGVPGMNAGAGDSPPVRHLYDYLTEGRPLEGYAEGFTQWLSNTYRDEAGLMAVNAAELRDRLVQYLRDQVYLPQLMKMNLFDLVTLCCVMPGERPEVKVEDVLLAHLHHIGGLARKLVAFEDQLWSEGSGTLNTSLYLGMSWRDGMQRKMLDRARSRLGPIAKEGTSPMVANAIDPHRMQVVYGQHAISLGTIPDFYQESNSSMGEFLHHQRAWQGDATRPYGQSRAPVFSNGETERLVMDPSALADGHPQARRALWQRVVRKPQRGAGGAAHWVDPTHVHSNGHSVPANGHGAPAGHTLSSQYVSGTGVGRPDSSWGQGAIPGQ